METPPTHILSLQDGLRAAGSYLDAHAYDLTSLALVPDGIVVVVTPANGPASDASKSILLTHAALQHHDAANRARPGSPRWLCSADPLFPTGHEDVLRAIGALAARYEWTWLRLVQHAGSLLLHHGTRQDRTSTELTAENMGQILELAYIQRGAIQWALARSMMRPGAADGA